MFYNPLTVMNYIVPSQKSFADVVRNIDIHWVLLPNPVETVPPKRKTVQKNVHGGIRNPTHRL